MEGEPSRILTLIVSHEEKEKKKKRKKKEKIMFPKISGKAQKSFTEEIRGPIRTIDKNSIVN